MISGYQVSSGDEFNMIKNKWPVIDSNSLALRLVPHTSYWTVNRVVGER